MRFYHVAEATEGGPYYAKLADAKRAAREIAQTAFDEILVEAVDVATDKENVLRLLNDSGGHEQGSTVVYRAKPKRRTP